MKINKDPIEPGLSKEDRERYADIIASGLEIFAKIIIFAAMIFVLYDVFFRE